MKYFPDSTNENEVTKPMSVAHTTNAPLVQQEGANLNSSEDYYYYYDDAEHDAIIYRQNKSINVLKLEQKDYVSQLVSDKAPEEGLAQRMINQTVVMNSTGILLNNSTNGTALKIDSFLDRLEDLNANLSISQILVQQKINITTVKFSSYIPTTISSILENGGGSKYNNTLNSAQSKFPEFFIDTVTKATFESSEVLNEEISIQKDQESSLNVTEFETIQPSQFDSTTLNLLNEEIESSTNKTDEEFETITTTQPEPLATSTSPPLNPLLNEIDEINNNLLVTFLESIKISDEDLGLLNTSNSQLIALSTHINRIADIILNLRNKDPFDSLNFRGAVSESNSVPILSGIMNQKQQVADLITRVRQNNKLFGINRNTAAPLDNIKSLIKKIREH